MSDAVAGPVSGPCVVDASTALKWVLQEEGSVAAVTLLDGRPLYAPPLIYIEVANALWSAVRRQRLLPEEAADALDLITRAPLRQAGEDASLAARALQLSAYRLAWARVRGVPEHRVRGAFFHAATGETVWPVLPGAEEITRVLGAARPT